MPYTPPSKASAPDSAAGSAIQSQRSSEPNARPALPRSASYLTKHRRSPSSITSLSTSHVVSNQQPTPPGTTIDLKGLVGSESVRQSPPPVTDQRGMPSGAVISPPDSPSGSDDEGLEMRGRSDLDRSKERELKAAVSHISLKRESSPTRLGGLILPSSAVVEGMHQSFSTGALDQLASRKKSHARSSTESDVALVNSSLTGSEEESDDEPRVKPPMIRKKSGELVRPALRPASKRRPSSMPGTPTFAKAVHFDSHLEHVRHFLQVDRPLAVSAGSSPIDNFESDSEYPFPSEDEQPSRRGPPFEWEMITANFPSETIARKALPVRVERIWLSKDQKSLHGSVAIANLAFHKFVACRFTLDYWKTTSEVAAEYSGEILPKTSPAGHDRWSFTIKLSDLANLHTKTMYFCVRYSVNGQEYWDNNNGANFQVDFRKRALPQNGKNGYQGAASRPATTTSSDLPRSNRRANPNTAPRPKSMPVGGFSSVQFMDSAKQAKITLDKSMDDFLDENGPLSLKKKRAGASASDDLTQAVSSPSGQAFGNRYDFGASLSQTKQTKQGARTKGVPGTKDNPTGRPALLVKAASAIVGTEVRSTSGTDSPTRGDYTYDEILDRFCFFGSKQPGQQAKEATTKTRYDGPDDGFSSMSDATKSSYQPRSHPLYRTGPAQHHAFRIHDGPYLHAGMTGSIVSSAASSPGTSNRPESPMRSGSPASLTGNLSPRAGTSPYHAQRHGRFFRPETHVTTAIRG